MKNYLDLFHAFLLGVNRFSWQVRNEVEYGLYLRLKNYFRRLETRDSEQEVADTNHDPNFLQDSLEIVYINLEKRGDRRLKIESELEKLGIHNSKRFEAIENPNGALGCAYSHLEVLETAFKSGKSILVFEDDCQIVSTASKFWSLVEEFYQNDELAILCLANRPIKKTLIRQVSSSLSKARRIRTTACYIAKNDAIPSILSDFKRSIRYLELGKNPQVFAIDVTWEKSQLRLSFAIPNEPVAIQRPSFSDIEKKFVSY